MARVTIEDCLEKVDNQYDLVLLAKERTYQLISGAEPQVPKDNDKRTVIALREIAEEKVKIEDLEHSAINKLRKYPEGEEEETDDVNEVEDDEFQKVYKGEVSKSGVPVLPSKRGRNVLSSLNIEKKISEKEATAKESSNNTEINDPDNVEEKKPDNVEEKKQEPKI